MMEQSSVAYSKMDMDKESRMSWKDRVHGKYSLILLVSGAVVLFILFVMVFVLFGHQEGKFSELENRLKSHSSSTNSINSDLKDKLQNTGTELETKVAELKSSLSSLSSYVDLYTSRTHDQLNNGPQVKKLSDIQNLVNNLSSSLGSLSSKLESMLKDMASHQGSQNTKIQTFLESLNSSVSELTTKLQNTIVHQDKKQTETDISLATLNSSLASFAPQLKNLTKAWGYQNGKNIMVESSVLNLTTSIKTLASRITSKDEKVGVALSNVKSYLESMNQSAVSHSNMLSGVQASVLKLTSSLESLSSNVQNIDQRVNAALNDVKSKPEIKSSEAGNTAAVSSCRPGWILQLSRCFLFSTDTLNWHQARDYCRSQNAMLIKVEAHEWRFISQTAKGQNYWVGLTDENTGQWRWDDGYPFLISAEQWCPGQPDDWKNHGVGEEGEGEDCGHFSWCGKLNDSHCSMEMKYICKA